MEKLKNKLTSYKKELSKASLGILTVILILGGMLIISYTSIQLYKIYTNDKQITEVISYCKDIKGTLIINTSNKGKITLDMSKGQSIGSNTGDILSAECRK